ncbi:hypothetical protein HYW19_00895 [Candidatus Woesearchaeota archaeon]|nr:hypothetical protein [Candidatus Woesearchaeota archaeon]
MNKKAQDPLTIVGGILVLIFLIWFIPQLFQSVKDVSCENEKKTIGNLNSQLSQCQTDLSVERAKIQLLQNEFKDCQDKLSQSQESFTNCTNSYKKLEEDYIKKEQLIYEYSLIKVYSSKITLFDLIILHNFNLFGIFLAFGITFTIKLFEIDVEVKVLNKKNQRKLVRIIREYLINHPWTPILIMLGIITITNIFIKFL